MIEDFGVAAERIAERRALLDARLYVSKNGSEKLVVGLSLKDVEALHDGKARVDHGREEARKRDDIFLADARANLKINRLRFFFDFRRLQLLGAQPLVDRVFGLGLHRTFADLARPSARLPNEFGHRP